MRVNRIVTAAALCLALPAVAQIEVMEPGDGGQVTEPAYTEPAYTAPAPSRQSRPAPPARSGDTPIGELYNQVLQLQEEVRQLQGIVEEQTEQLRQLKQQRLDDYVGLDRRITALGGGAAPSTPADPGSGAAQGGLAAMPPTQQPVQSIRADVPPQPPASRPAAPVAGEDPAYQAAYELVRNRRFPEATNAFNDFLAQFPQGALAGNAHYWLGELYLLDGNSDQAKRHFESLVYQYTDNAKLPDGMFKLGRIYHQEGDDARARELLDRVVTDYTNSGSSAPRLASDYLKQNFPTQ